MTYYSYNGWPAATDGASIGIDPNFAVNGVTFPGGVKSGDVATVFSYLVTQIHTRVEPLVTGWCWGYEPKMNVNDPSSISCHASGTAIDYNAPNHPNGTYRGGWDGAQVATIQAILAECGGVVSWLDAYDPMHFEIQGGAADVADVAARLAAGGAGGNGDDDMPLSSDDVNRIADEVMDRLTNAKVLDMLTIDDKGAESTEPASVTRALQSAQTQAARGTYTVRH